SINEGLDEGDYPSGYDSVAPGSGFDTAYEVDPNTGLEFLIGAGYLRFDYYASLEIADPTGSVLATETMTTPANGAQSVDFADGYALDGDDFECGLEGERVYATVQFTVLESGEFTFRVVDVSPLQSGEYRDQGYGFEWWYYYPNPWGDYVPISDPYLVLYSSFDPAMPNEGQIDCNDDTNAIDTPSGVQARDSAGRFISDLYPELVVDLVPGDYTLLVTTYDEVESVDITTTPTKVDAASIPLTPANYEFEGLPEQSAIVEFWGAEGSLELLGADVDPELADTGADVPLQAGLALGAVLALLLGALGIAVARRRTV
ncbi:MAG: hypothetical protein Q7J04_03600, partial [Microcella sp.]|nr:hypothetical protein [Microcella sp.]